MRPPKRIVIGNHVFKVRLGSIRSGALLGQTTHRKTLIKVDGSCSASQVRDTVLHEVLHAVINDGPNDLDPDVEERIVRVIAPALLGVLRNNPQLLEFLLEE